MKIPPFTYIIWLPNWGGNKGIGEKIVNFIENLAKENKNYIFV